MGERQGTPWTGHQCNTQTTMHTLIHTPKGNLERPINLNGMSLDCGRKSEYPQRPSCEVTGHGTTGAQQWDRSGSRGTGRIPRGQQDQLLAVIPCNDVRLQPRRTKLYVCISMVICLLLCCLILFFFFPRSVTLTPVSVLSVMVYFTPNSVDMQVKNLINITNENFVPVQIADFTMQGLVDETVVGHTKISNMTAILSRSRKS
ncbi:hypothetical protein ATANTOWER_028610, partial [Ataeniobius toweri]|nr:hypothetical protein [Ataeniobius toweri]